jgi:hypothetical protein
MKTGVLWWLKVWFEQVPGIKFVDIAHSFIAVFGNLEQVEVFLADVYLSQHGVTDPVIQTLPVIFAGKNDWEPPDLSGLDQRQRFK